MSQTPEKLDDQVEVDQEEEGSPPLGDHQPAEEGEILIVDEEATSNATPTGRHRHSKRGAATSSQKRVKSKSKSPPPIVAKKRAAQAVNTTNGSQVKLKVDAVRLFDTVPDATTNKTANNNICEDITNHATIQLLLKKVSELERDSLIHQFENKLDKVINSVNDTIKMNDKARQLELTAIRNRMTSIEQKLGETSNNVNNQVTSISTRQSEYHQLVTKYHSLNESLRSGMTEVKTKQVEISNKIEGLIAPVTTTNRDVRQRSLMIDDQSPPIDEVTTRKCPFCGNTNHGPEFCSKIRTALERRTYAAKKQICSICLEKISEITLDKRFHDLCYADGQDCAECRKYAESEDKIAHHPAFCPHAESQKHQKSGNKRPVNHHQNPMHQYGYIHQQSKNDQRHGGGGQRNYFK